MGPSEIGKTTVGQKIIKSLETDIDLVIIISPTLPLDHAIEMFGQEKIMCIIREMKTSTWKKIRTEIETHHQDNPDIKFLLFIDDNTGNNALHGGHNGVFGNIAATCRHWNTSICCIAHQGKSVGPAFRNVLTHLIAFPPPTRMEAEFLIDEIGDHMLLKPSDIRDILIYAWTGGRSDLKEWKQHFVLIKKPPRERDRYFIDFNEEIEIQ